MCYIFFKALCNYRSDDSAATAGSDIKNALKNRYRDVLPCKFTGYFNDF